MNKQLSVSEEAKKAKKSSNDDWGKAYERKNPKLAN